MTLNHGRLYIGSGMVPPSLTENISASMNSGKLIVPEKLSTRPPTVVEMVEGDEFTRALIAAAAAPISSQSSSSWTCGFSLAPPVNASLRPGHDMPRQH